MKGKAFYRSSSRRLTDILTTARHYRLEPKRIQFIHPKEGKESNIVLIELIKDGQPGGVRIFTTDYYFDENNEYTDKLKEVLWG